MTGRVEGKVAFITGAARSQGRSHAVHLAKEGADIIAVDACAPISGIDMYPMPTEQDLAETARQVEALDRRVVTVKVDVRDSGGLRAAVDRGVAELGRLDIVVANAGVVDICPSLDLDDDVWQRVIDINLTGVWNTCKAALPHLISGGQGGSIVLISSTSGLKGTPNLMHYTASKHGVVGVMRTIAAEFGHQSIRCNSIHPGGVDTIMVQNETTYRIFDPGNPNPDRESSAPLFASTNVLPVSLIDCEDISNAVVFLASQESRYVTGATLPVDAGFTVR